MVDGLDERFFAAGLDSGADEMAHVCLDSTARGKAESWAGEDASVRADLI
jgi:hypothetical protein